MTLRGIWTVSKWKPCSAATFERVEMDVRIFVAGESDVADFAGFLCGECRFHGAAVGEDAVGIVEANDFVVLDEINVIGLQAFEAGFDLAFGSLFGAAIDFRHQKNFLAIAVFQSFAHEDFALAFVVVPTVVHEGDAAIDGGADELNALVVGESVFRDMKTAHPDRGNFLAGASERAIEHVALAGSGVLSERDLIHGTVLLAMAWLREGMRKRAGYSADGGSFEEITAFHKWDSSVVGDAFQMSERRRGVAGFSSGLGTENAVAEIPFGAVGDDVLKGILRLRKCFACREALTSLRMTRGKFSGLVWRWSRPGRCLGPN